MDTYGNDAIDVYALTYGNDTNDGYNDGNGDDLPSVIFGRRGEGEVGSIGIIGVVEEACFRSREVEVPLFL